MSTNTAIKTLSVALNEVFPVPNTPHTSVKLSNAESRIAFRFGWEARDAEIADLRTALEAAQQQLAAIEPPSFSRDPDGDLALDWRVGDAALSVSFSTEGSVAWAATIAGKAFSGAEQVAQRAGSAEPYGRVFGIGKPFLKVGAINPWKDAAQALPVFTAPPAAVQPERTKLSPMQSEEDHVAGVVRQWYFDCEGHYIDVALDNGKYSIFFRDRATQGEGWLDQSEQPDSGRDAALLDLQYDAGARAGFMAGAAGDDSFIDKLDRRVAGAVGTLKAAQQGEQAPGAK